jgi:DNA-binding transcriptional MerR regulator
VLVAEAGWMTVAELADRLGVSESTVRNWRRAFRDQIPERVGPDTYRRYSLATFERIAAMRARNLPPAAIRASLEREADDEQPLASTDERLLILLERIAVALERIADSQERG